MYTKFKKINSKGFTLIEILASITILGVVVAVFLPIFPQLMNWTKNVDDELGASNLLGRVANEVKDLSVFEFFGEDIYDCNRYLAEDVYYKNYPLNGEMYEAKLNVCKESDVNLYRTNIKIYSGNDRLLSESYTYITGEPDE